MERDAVENVQISIAESVYFLSLCINTEYRIYCDLQHSAVDRSASAYPPANLFGISPS